ncbi:MAG: hypothetical protein JJV98_06075 [Desulfosarcina sp.]|nr:hypothetical protein [Desulfobacterales bacterium]
MELSQSEIVQICRRRAGLNQGTLGADAFNTSFESGRTKIKNIELGRQKPTQQDIENLARVLNIPVSALIPNPTGKVRGHDATSPQGLDVSEKTIEQFPGLDAYLEMLNKAVLLNDRELIDYIAEKLARLFSDAAPNEGQITEAPL